MGLDRIRQHPAYDFKVLAILSPGDPYHKQLRQLCEQHGIEVCNVPNDPLGRKKNEGLQVARQYDWDWFMDLGSDNLLSGGLLDTYLSYLEKETPIFGVQGMTIVDAINKKVKLFGGYTKYNEVLGGGRIIRRDILPERPWKDTARIGMDFYSANKIWEEQGIRPEIVECKHGLMDIKTLTNLNGHDRDDFEGLPEHNLEEIAPYIGNLEYEALQNLFETYNVTTGRHLPEI